MLAAAVALAVFTADNEQIFTVTLDLPVQACKNASLSVAKFAWYVLHACSAEPIELSPYAARFAKYPPFPHNL